MENRCSLCHLVNPVSEWVCESCGAPLPMAGERKNDTTRNDDQGNNLTNSPLKPSGAPTTTTDPLRLGSRSVGNPAGATFDAASVAHLKGRFSRFQLVFGLVFTLAAMGFGALSVVLPALQMRAARAWIQTPCVITHSVVVRSLGSSGTKRPSKPHHSLSLSYEYKIQGRTYRSTTYAFDTRKISGLEASTQAAARLPRGTATVCFVNPLRPEEAVLKRDAQEPRWMLLLPLILLGAGIAVTFDALRRLRDPR